MKRSAESGGAADTTITKVDSRFSPRGAMGQKYLASGRRISMRMWEEDPGDDKGESVREYETVGYVVRGRAELHLEGQTVVLEPGNSWVVPDGARHRYRILEPFTAIEANSPPSHVEGRDRAGETEPRREKTAAERRPRE